MYKGCCKGEGGQGGQRQNIKGPESPRWQWGGNLDRDGWDRRRIRTEHRRERLRKRERERERERVEEIEREAERKRERKRVAIIVTFFGYFSLWLTWAIFLSFSLSLSLSVLLLQLKSVQDERWRRRRSRRQIGVSHAMCLVVSVPLEKENALCRIYLQRDTHRCIRNGHPSPHRKREIWVVDFNRLRS